MPLASLSVQGVLLPPGSLCGVATTGAPAAWAPEATGVPPLSAATCSPSSNKAGPRLPLPRLRELADAQEPAPAAPPLCEEPARPRRPLAAEPGGLRCGVASWPARRSSITPTKPTPGLGGGAAARAEGGSAPWCASACPRRGLQRPMRPGLAPAGRRALLASLLGGGGMAWASCSSSQAAVQARRSAEGEAAGVRLRCRNGRTTGSATAAGDGSTISSSSSSPPTAAAGGAAADVQRCSGGRRRAAAVWAFEATGGSGASRWACTAAGAAAGSASGRCTAGGATGGAAVVAADFAGNCRGAAAGPAARNGACAAGPCCGGGSGGGGGDKGGQTSRSDDGCRLAHACPAAGAMRLSRVRRRPAPAPVPEAAAAVAACWRSKATSRASCRSPESSSSTSSRQSRNISRRQVRSCPRNGERRASMWFFNWINTGQMSSHMALRSCSCGVGPPPPSPAAAIAAPTSSCAGCFVGRQRPRSSLHDSNARLSLRTWPSGPRPVRGSSTSPSSPGRNATRGPATICAQTLNFCSTVICASMKR
mmetsp:Transcript_14290/g.44500  ORF Transcript_14290/g.44500 Transcript_14290/m.44500 type:complete len:537 (-) Transcript_14290:719-2329(-)